jgi:hypothetical protein
MKTLTVSVALLWAGSAAWLFGQTGVVGGPAIGFVFDGTAQALRPVRGIPGASTLGDPVDAGFALTWATVAPGQDSAMVTASDGSLHLLRLGAGVAAVNCAACPSTAEAAVYSPGGTSVALYSAGRVQIVTGLPSNPAAGASFEVGDRLARAGGGRSAAPPMALSDDGAWLLASMRVGVNLFSANGGPRTLLATAPYALVAFAAGGHDAAIADAAGAGLVLVHDVAGAATQQALAGADAIRHAGALAFSADGSQVFVASGADQTVSAIGTASGAITVTACSFPPSGLVPMGNVMRLNEAGNGPVWLLDVAYAAGPRVVFVPAVAPVQ